MAIIRVRTKAGTWRIDQIDINITLSNLIARIESEKQIKITKVCLNQQMTRVASDNLTLNELGLKHGSMIFV